MRWALTSELDLAIEPVFESTAKLLEAGATAPDFKMNFHPKTEISLSELVQKGPVLLNFIKGTWCPFCQTHMKHLKDWKAKLFVKNVILLVISCESVETIRHWVQANPVDFLFGSVMDPAVFMSYGVNLEEYEFPKPATFLIERKMVVRMSYAEARGISLKEQVEKAVS